MGQDPQALIKQAEKALSGGGGFSFFGGGKTEKLENAADLYTQAASLYHNQIMKVELNRSRCISHAKVDEGGRNGFREGTVKKS